MRARVDARDLCFSPGCRSRRGNDGDSVLRAARRRFEGRLSNFTLNSGAAAEVPQITPLFIGNWLCSRQESVRCRLRHLIFANSAAIREPRRGANYLFFKVTRRKPARSRGVLEAAHIAAHCIAFVPKASFRAPRRSAL